MSLTSTRADQLKPSLWADFMRLTNETLINNLAESQARNEALTTENESLKKQLVLLTPKPEIIRTVGDSPAGPAPKAPKDRK